MRTVDLFRDLELIVRRRRVGHDVFLHLQESPRPDDHDVGGCDGPSLSHEPILVALITELLVQLGREEMEQRWNKVEIFG